MNSLNTKRRTFLKMLLSGAILSFSSIKPIFTKPLVDKHSEFSKNKGRVVAISSYWKSDQFDGLRTVKKAIKEIKRKKSALDAVVSGVNLAEADPHDFSVGYGGIPNERGVVQLDAAVMHGPWARAGSVACLEGIKYPSKVARKVMERTDHVLLVGKGAQEFAVMHGFKIEELLTEESRERWLKWKENISSEDDYLPYHDLNSNNMSTYYHLAEHAKRFGTIHCSAMDYNSDISSCTTTSGLFYKIPGRVGDSPIVGAGLYCDNEVGAAGSTGRGEANLENLSSFLIVERMRLGDSPQEACLHAVEKIAKITKLSRLKDKQGRPNFNVNLYALNKKGECGGAAIWQGSQMAVATEKFAKAIDLAFLYKK